MASRIVERNRVSWQSQDWSRKKKPYISERDVDETGQLIDVASAIPPDSPKSLFRAGEAVLHPGDKIYYRVVDYLPPRDGWASTDFWQDRWKVDHKAVLAFAARGFLDPAMETGSQICRFRCRDEYGLKTSDVWRLHKNRLLRAVKARNKQSKAAKEKENTVHANAKRYPQNLLKDWG